jgi:hypothetical protein
VLGFFGFYAVALFCQSWTMSGIAVCVCGGVLSEAKAL